MRTKTREVDRHCMAKTQSRIRHEDVRSTGRISPLRQLRMLESIVSGTLCRIGHGLGLQPVELVAKEMT